MAIQILKRAGDHNVKIAGMEVEVAWTCIASIMTLGPNLVHAHLPQLLVLCWNALPKPTSKDTTSNTGRSPTEWMFLLHKYNPEHARACMLLLRVQDVECRKEARIMASKAQRFVEAARCRHTCSR